MTLKKLLEDNAAWLDQAAKQRVFDKVDQRALDLPEAQRQQRIADLKLRIEDLSRRKTETIASYDRSIALEKSELDGLMAERPLRQPAKTKKAASAPSKKKKA